MGRSLYGVFNMRLKRYEEVMAEDEEVACGTMEWESGDCLVGRLFKREVKDAKVKAIRSGSCTEWA